MKKKISFLLAVILLLAQCVIASAATIKTRSELYDRADLLLDILLEDDILSGNPEDTVSRAEFVVALGRLFRYTDKITEKGLFDDVSLEHYAANEVYNARALGYLDAVDYFNPDGDLTSGAAIKLAVCYAGYGKVAEAEGGFPSGYFQIAVKNDFLDGLTNEFYSGPVSVKSAKILLYNLMIADYVGVESVSEVITRYEKYPSNLAVIHEIFMKTGVVNACGISSLYGEPRNEKDVVEIDGVSYKASKNYSNFLGYRATAFYTVDGDVRTILGMITDRNEICTFNLTDFIGFSGGSLNYHNEANEKISLSVDNTQKVLVYNGNGIAFDSSLFTGDGSVTVIDNDNDGKFEVILLDKYRYGKVASISTSSGEIGFEKSYGLDTIVLDEEVSYFIENADGEEITIYDIKKEDYLAVKESRDGQIIKVTLCDNVVTGKLTFIESSDNKIGINDETYVISELFKNGDFSKISLGGVYDFVLGVDSTVVAYDFPGSDYIYAYLIEFGETRTLREVKLYTQMGEMLYAPVHKKIRVDSVKSTDKDFLSDLTNGVYPCPSLVKVKVDSNDVLTHIDFPETYNNTINKNALTEQNNLLRYTFPVTSFTYRSGAKSCMPYFNLKDTVIFRIPNDITDEANFSIKDNSYLSDNVTYTFDTYDINDAGSAGAIVSRFNPKNNTFNYHHNTYIVDSIRYGQDAEDNDAMIVRCWSLGKFYEYYLTDDIVVNKDSGTPLGGGDIFRVKVNDNNNITAIVVDFDASSGIPVKNSYAGEIFELSNVSLTYQFGKIYNVVDGYTYMTNTKDDFGEYDYSFENLKNYYINSRYIVKYDPEEGVRPITQDELKSYLAHGEYNHYAVLRQNVFNINSMYVYE